MVETKFQTSFIPKKPLSVETSQKTGISLFLLISILAFLVSLGIGAYVFLENKILIQKITAEKQTIETNRSGLVTDSVTIESIVELNSRINVANKLLDSHVAVSPIFNFLQKITLKNVRFKDFAFSATSKDANGQSVVGITMAGQARDFETVAAQADEFGKVDWRNIIKEPKISGLNLNQDGSVSFTFSGFIVPAFLLYTKPQ